MSQDQGEPSSMEGAEPESIGGVAAGERLKNARLALGLSVSDVATRLKLNIQKIESLERGDISNIAAPVFVAGYLRAYARLLELSEDDVLVDFEMLSAAESLADGGVSETVVESSSIESVGAKSSGVIFTGQPSRSSGNIFRNSNSLLMPAVLSVLVVAAVYFALQGDESDENAQLASVAGGELNVESTEADEMPLVIDSAKIEQAIETEPSVETAPLVESPPLAINETSVVAEASVNVLANEAGQNEIVNNGSKAEVFQQSELALVFNDESWVEVTDARGERLVYRLAKAGMSRTVTGVAPFTVQLGYVPGVEIFYNGVPHDLSHLAGRRSARFRVGNANDSTAGG